MIKRFPLCTLALAAVGLAAPATGHALGGGTNQKCYTHVPLAKGSVKTQPIVATVNGGTPGASFQVVARRKNGNIAGSASGNFNAAGAGIAALTNLFPSGSPLGPLKGEKLKITVEDYTSNVTASLGTVRLTNAAIGVNFSKPRNIRRKRTVRVSGTPLRKKKVYGFVTSKNGKKVLRRFKIGRTNGCGYAKTKAYVAPRGFAYGRYRLYINAGRKLKRKKAIFTRFRIYRTFI